MKDIIKKTVIEIVKLATTNLPTDVDASIREYREKEESAVGKDILSAIVTNFEVARETTTVMCQDTGFPIFYVKIGENFPINIGLRSIITEAVQEATKAVPVRPNTVDVLKGTNPGDNSGKYAPFINFDIVDGDYLEIAYFPKGGGSENMSSLSMLKPGQGIKGVKEAILKTVINAHSGQPCNPIVVGVGVGGGSDIALKIAKTNILYRKMGERHPDPEIASIEKEMLEAINDIGYGPMGLGGKTTALEVFIDFGARHPASLPVGVVVQCWANRRGIARIYPDKRVEILSHKVETPMLSKEV